MDHPRVREAHPTLKRRADVQYRVARTRMKSGLRRLLHGTSLARLSNYGLQIVSRQFLPGER
jgi:hypothetical protein